MSSSASPPEDASECPEEQSSQSSLFDEADSVPTLAPQQFDYPEYDAAWNTYLDWDLPDAAYQDYSMTVLPNGRPDGYDHEFTCEQIATQKSQWPATIDAPKSAPSTRPALGNTSVQASCSTTQPTPNLNFENLNYFTEATPLGDEFFQVGFSGNSYDLDSFEDTGAVETDAHFWPQTSSTSVQSLKEPSEDEPPKVQPIGFTSAKHAASVVRVVPSYAPKSVSSTEVNEKRKLAHSIIEKNYRSRISTGMAELRECVPIALDTEDALLNQSSRKISVLADAVQYVKTLQLRNRSLTDTMDNLRRRNDLLQKIALSKIGPKNPASQETINTLAQEELQASAEPFSDLKARKRIKKSPLAVLDVNEAPRASHSRRPTNKLERLRKQYGSVTKLAMGTLAAIAVLEGMAENDSNGKMLFAIPTQIINKGWQVAASGFRSISFGHDSPAIITLLKVFLMLTILLQVLPPLFRMKTEVNQYDLKSSSTALLTARLASSPNEGRRDAWLTSIQSVSVPSRHLCMELGALGYKLCKVVLRRLLGWQTYAHLTGTSADDEKARIKAWDIAIDAQLAGGDRDICWNRLLFTFLASTTLPDTPARLMLKALHVQVINAFVHGKGYLRWIDNDRFAHAVSEFYWDKARIMQNNPRPKSANVVDVTPDPLPPCCAALLAQPSRQVFNVAIAMRAYCLALNETHDRIDIICDEGIDTVVDDIEVRSPIQALAAWWSSLCLRRALFETLNATSTAHNTESVIYKDISLALTSAPRGSVAETRALTSRAVFCASERQKSIEAALEILPIAISQRKSDTSPHEHPILSMVRPTIESVCTTSVRISLRAAILLERASHGPVDRATVALLVSLGVALDEDDVSLLGFAAAYQCLRECVDNPVLLKAMPGEIRGLAARLRGLIGSSWSNWSEGHGVPDTTIKRCIEVCSSISKERPELRASG
jgi:hypothetical protein